jgi:hypothetical protein
MRRPYLFLMHQKLSVTSKLLLVAFLVAGLCACSSEGDDSKTKTIKLYCARGENGCRCNPRPFGLLADEVAVDSCSGGEYSCCFDLDAEGFTTDCQCVTWVCTGGDTSCECHWRSERASSTISQSSCTAKKSGSNTFAYEGQCCSSDEACNCAGKVSSTSTVTSCFNSDTTQDCGSRPPVRDCTHFSSSAAGQGRPATSCDGLKWRQ